MDQQMPEEPNLNMQEFLSRRRFICSPGQIGTCRRPYTSPLNSRRDLNGVVSSDGKLDDSLHSEKQINCDQYGAKVCNSHINSISAKSRSPTSSYAEYKSPVNPNLNLTRNYPPIHSRVLMGQGENYLTSAYNELPPLQYSKTLNVQRKARTESIIEWFDRTVEAELEKRRNASTDIGENSVNLPNPNVPLPKDYLLHQASAAGINLEGRRHPDLHMDLLEAVDKLAKAEAMIAFESATCAPPELSNTASVTGAKSFQAELTGLVKQEFPGVKPIEVIGYVGITRPRKPRKSIFGRQ